MSEYYKDSDGMFWEHDGSVNEVYPLDIRGERIPLEEGPYPTYDQWIEELGKENIFPSNAIQMVIHYCKYLEDKIENLE